MTNLTDGLMAGRLSTSLSTVLTPTYPGILLLVAIVQLRRQTWTASRRRRQDSAPVQSSGLNQTGNDERTRGYSSDPHRIASHFQ
jgi:hypothetical protein